MDEACKGCIHGYTEVSIFHCKKGFPERPCQERKLKSDAVEESKPAPGNRIAVRMIHNFPIPLQRGEQGSKEREESNIEIHNHLLSLGLSIEDLSGDGYYIPVKWQESKDYVHFTYGNKWRSARKNCVVFETENPDFIEGIAKQTGDLEADMGIDVDEECCDPPEPDTY